MTEETTHRFLLAGGGTGGHIYPALAIADALRRERPGSRFLFVGAAGKMEMRRVPAAGYEIRSIPVTGFQRGFDKRNLTFPFKLASSLAQVRSIVAGFGPSAAIGTGGYVSGPALLAARLRGVPIFLQEQNAYRGSLTGYSRVEPNGCSVHTSRRTSTSPAVSPCNPAIPCASP